MTYHLSATMATASRVLKQLTHDHRSLAMIFFVPPILLALLYWLYLDHDPLFNFVGVSLLGVFPLVIMFLITSIATLRERIGGTLERVMAMPIARIDFVFGYAIAFGVLAVIQAVIASAVALYLLGLDIAGPGWFLILIALADAWLGMALGLLVSAFAHNEFQAVQFMPVVIFPQFFLCGLLLPLDKMPDVLSVIAHLVPMTYAVQALQNIGVESGVSLQSWRDLIVVVVVVVVAILLGASTLRRSSK
ncbi:MAG TPA: ABC transporter permease [Candidatus Saccharimonadales bacterium]|nr:ABC transporter permease [Candidatus Saccharimonadales bacterium]